LALSALELAWKRIGASLRRACPREPDGTDLDSAADLLLSAALLYGDLPGHAVLAALPEVDGLRLARELVVRRLAERPDGRCRHDRGREFIGVQHTVPGLPDLRLYNCAACRTTLAVPVEKGEMP